MQNCVSSWYETKPFSSKQHKCATKVIKTIKCQRKVAPQGTKSIEKTPQKQQKQKTTKTRTHADPTKVMLAQPARHVVAALVLLNARVARGALAGVG